MAGGWAQDGAVHEQIEASVSDEVARARSQVPRGESLERCDDGLDNDCDGLVNQDCPGVGNAEALIGVGCTALPDRPTAALAALLLCLLGLHIRRRTPIRTSIVVDRKPPRWLSRH